jgi:protein TonB
MIRARHAASAAIPAFVVSCFAVGMLSAGTPALKVYFASSFKDQAYQQATFKKVAAAWKRPAGTPEPGHKAVVIADILRNGTCPSPRLHLASGSDAWDAAALEAVRKALPFDPLPSIYKSTSVEAHFHFEYNK